MRRCIHLARFGTGSVSPNPLVGAVIVYEGMVIGEGFHKQFGGAHAEVNAIHSVKDKSLLPASTLYVSLEPCSHYGKTPPCTELIIESRIPKVVIGSQDPFQEVNGKGIARLREAGVEVITGVLEEDCDNLNKRFITLQTLHRPYITLKWAMSGDGFIGKPGQRIQISNEATRIHSHYLRHCEQSILVGARTILSDNPRLNTRTWPGTDPIRIVADPRGRLIETSSYHVFDGSVRTIVYTSARGKSYAESEVYTLNDQTSPAAQMIHHLGKLKIDSVLVEGGSVTLKMFLENGIWDECYIYQSSTKLIEGIPAPEIPNGIMKMKTIGDNQLIHILKG
ncbi:MAG: bifunctional diaminohydroxyphosphoribosylaminopyrimidine deaminase/5-amino-6-(5-phosphoribosylamino)uracil reductase RibD [Bacteroidia bacterium]